jgi:hypothetical protein
MLTNAHQASLKTRAIPAASAIAAGIRSAQTSENAVMLGIPVAPAAMHIPYMEPSGAPVIGDDGLEIIRARNDYGEPKYASRAGAGFSVYLPPLIREQIVASAREDEPSLSGEFIVITEGELKALSVEANLGIAAIGLPGVTMYRDPSRDKAEPTDVSTPLHPHLAAVLALARGVLVVADSDAAENPQVRGAMRSLQEAISNQFRIPSAYLEVPAPKKTRGRPSKAKDTRGAVAGDAEPKTPKIGIDDWIAQVGAGGVDYVTAALRKAFRTEVERQKALKSGGYVPLGYKIDDNTGAGSYFVYSGEKKAVIRIASGDLLNQSQLLHACGPDWLRANYETFSKAGVKGIDTLSAGGDLQKACTAAGFWDDTRKVGAGVWPIEGDRSAVIVNSSSELWSSDGREVHAVDPAPRGRVYMSTLDLGVTSETEPASAQESAEVLAALQTFTWRDHRDADLALGWLSASYLCGALDVRPALYTFGRRGSGKSQLMHTMKALSGAMSAECLEGTSVTEPGLRRELGTTSRTTFVDEAEAKDKPERLQAVISYIRSSYGGGASKMGNGGGGTDRFVIRTMTALAAINPLALDGSEESRFIRLGMYTRTSADASTLKSHPLAIDHSLARALAPKLAARMIRSWPRFVAAYDIARNLLNTQADDWARYFTTMGTVIAAGWVMLNDGQPTAEAISAYMSGLDIETQRQRILESGDEANPLQWLLSKIVTVDVFSKTMRLTVSELIIPAGNEWGTRNRSTPHADALGRMGMRVGLDDDGERVLFVNPNNIELLDLFSQSPWAAVKLKQALVDNVPSCSRKQRSKAMTIGAEKVKPLVIGLADMLAPDEYEPAP